MISSCMWPRRLTHLITQRRHFKTLKSRNDEQNAQELLKRLQKLAINTEKRAEPPPHSENHDEYRCLSFDRVRKLITFYQQDPLTWNPSVLGRIFKIPENHCENLVRYVGPMVYFATNEYDEVQQMFELKYVVDVGRLKSDDNYLVNYKRIVFPDQHDSK